MKSRGGEAGLRGESEGLVGVWGGEGWECSFGAGGYFSCWEEGNDDGGASILVCRLPWSMLISGTSSSSPECRFISCFSLFCLLSLAWISGVRSTYEKMLALSNCTPALFR